jgi:hypothetical protein
VWPPEWYHLQDFRVLFSEREGNGHRGVPRFDLAECPPTDRALDFGVEFGVAGRRGDHRDADDFPARGNRELQRDLALEAGLFLRNLL